MVRCFSGCHVLLLGSFRHSLCVEKILNSVIIIVRCRIWWFCDVHHCLSFVCIASFGVYTFDRWDFRARDKFRKCYTNAWFCTIFIVTRAIINSRAQRSLILVFLEKKPWDRDVSTTTCICGLAQEIDHLPTFHILYFCRFDNFTGKIVTLMVPRIFNRWYQTFFMAVNTHDPVMIGQNR